MGPQFALPNEDDDGDLVARVRSGDEGAFDRLFRRYYAPLCDFADRYLHAHDDAREVVQDVFARIWRQRATWRVTSGVRAYLFGAARNGAANALRHRNVRARHAAPWVEAERVASPDETQEGDAARAIDDLMHIASRMPERQRQAFFLRWEHGMSYAEIAAVLDISIKTVENHLHRAYAFLRAHVPNR